MTIFGPFHKVAHCTFCGTSDTYVFPAPFAANADYARLTGRKIGPDWPHFETTPTYCAPCCGVQEDGHEYEHEPGEGYLCKHCGEEPPRDWYNYDP